MLTRLTMLKRVNYSFYPGNAPNGWDVFVAGARPAAPGCPNFSLTFEAPALEQFAELIRDFMPLGAMLEAYGRAELDRIMALDL